MNTPLSSPSPDALSTGPFLNVAGYRFVRLNDLEELRLSLRQRARELGLKGTILLAEEGINLFLAGEIAPMKLFLGELRQREPFADLAVKESWSDHQPFTRMLVRIKREIISMGVPSIRPEQKTSPKLPPAELKKWLDEGRPVTLLDVRNDYEVELGTFRGAIPIGVDHFRQFPAAVERLPAETRDTPVVMFCTGGIRCEKAGPLMESKGYREIYQLEGGILQYFEDCGGAHYEGECFVFDKRVAVDPELQETDTEQCYLCQAIVSGEARRSEHYVPGVSCPQCYRPPAEEQEMRLAARNARLREVAGRLPGCQPYVNRRPLNVPLKYDHWTALDFVAALHDHHSREDWAEIFAAGRIEYRGQSLAATRPVRAGWRLEHVQPGTVEPAVATDVAVLYEDEDLIAVHKPAPLPMHPCGRFHRNTLLHFLSEVYPGQKLRMAHRLDANTTGVVLLARKRKVADHLRVQFERGAVEKRYLARVFGHPPTDRFACDAPISDGPRAAGQRIIEEGGLAALTNCEVISRESDGTAILVVSPQTGRTNQIRLHLWHLGFPIAGDPAYQPGGLVRERQTRHVDEPPLCLHAWQIEFRPPTGGRRGLVAPPPDWVPAAAAKTAESRFPR